MKGLCHVLTQFGCGLVRSLHMRGGSGGRGFGGGVYAILVGNAPDQYLLAKRARRNPGVDGLLIHLRWDQISPVCAFSRVRSAATSASNALRSTILGVANSSLMEIPLVRSNRSCGNL